jgi:hypothetical protein
MLQGIYSQGVAFSLLLDSSWLRIDSCDVESPDTGELLTYMLMFEVNTRRTIYPV